MPNQFRALAVDIKQFRIWIAAKYALNHMCSYKAASSSDEYSHSLFTYFLN